MALPVRQGWRVLASISLTWVAGAVPLEQIVAAHLARLQAAAAAIAARIPESMAP